jgi:RNA-dependent RNA polymerase
LYFAIWDKDLVPTRSMEPMDYAVPPSSSYECAGGIGASGEVTAQHISDFFVDYLKNDNLGRICNAHAAFADLSSEGAGCRECIILAELASKAVDFCKTGVPAEMTRELTCKAYPDFMENESKQSYPSSKILGKIYQRSKGMQFSHSPLSVTENGLDRALLIPGHEEYVDEAAQLLDLYVTELGNVAMKFEVWAEAELVSGFIAKVSRKASRHKENVNDALALINQAVREVQEKFTYLFWSGLESYTDEDLEWQSILKASAWYRVTYEQPIEPDYPPYLSFSWLPIKPMCQLKKLSSCMNKN